MKLSIIIPVYNVEPYLKDCMESILTQNFDDYEIICINDASTDGSLEILQNYAKKNSKIKVINNTVNGGLSFSRNSGIRDASGDYILFVDSDDMLCQGALKELSDEADRRNTDIIYFDMTYKYERTWPKEHTESSPIPCCYDDLYTGQELFVKLYYNNHLIVEVCRQLFSKKFLEKNKLYFYEGIVHEDNLFSIICAMKAERVTYLNRELYIYRKRGGSITSQLNAHRMTSLYIVFIELWDFWRNNIFSEEVNVAFSGYLREIYYKFERLRCYFPESNTLSLGGPAEQFMYSLMTADEHTHFIHTQLSDDQLMQIKAAEKVIVYGAGVYGSEIVRLLRLEKIKVDAVVVSNKDINPDKISGIKIEQVDQLKDLEHAVIIVAVAEKHQKGIVNKLKQLDILEHAVFLSRKSKDANSDECVNPDNMIFYNGVSYPDSAVM